MNFTEGWFQQSGHGGWTHWWMPENKEIFVVLADQGEDAKNKLASIYQAYLKDLKAKSDKHSLGEFSDEQFQNDCAQLAKKLREDYIDLISKY
jgi:phage baseplate assembly protein gpV